MQLHSFKSELTALFCFISLVSVFDSKSADFQNESSEKQNQNQCLIKMEEQIFGENSSKILHSAWQEKKQTEEFLEPDANS